MPHTLIARLARCAALAAALLAPVAWAAAPFTVNNDGTVTDAATGLMWDQCYLGQGSTGCAGGTNPTYIWVDALSAVKYVNATPGGYKGHTDWRLPNKNELESLVKIDAYAPAIDTVAFPDTSLYAFWSSTTVARTPSLAWKVEFNTGTPNTFYKTNAYHVRLVRSEQPLTSFDVVYDTPASSDGPITTDLRVTDNTIGHYVELSVTVNATGTGYWLLQRAADPAPIAATLKTSGSIKPVTANTATTFYHWATTSGTDYVVYFTAEDEAGVLQANVASVSFTTPARPGAPTDVTATPGAAGSGMVTVAWTAPAADNGSPITGYAVSPNPDYVRCTASPCTITGLPNAEEYTFTVRATNRMGDSPPGTSAAVMLQDTQTISFANPGTQAFGTTPTLAATGGASGQPVTFSATGVCSITGSQLSFASTGSCTVNANQAGTPTYVAAPAVQQTFTVTKGTQSINFSALAPQTFAAGGSFAIAASASSGLAVTYGGGTADVCSVSGTTVTMLGAGTCTLTGNQAGDANWNAAAQATQTVAITAIAPGAPTGVAATAGDAKATVTWVAPTATGGSPITGYTVAAVEDASKTCTPNPATALTCEVAGLANGTAYTFTATASNGSQTATSAPSNAVTPQGAQTISFANPGNQVFGATPTLSASATSSLTVTFTATGVCTLGAGNVLSFGTLGDCTVSANQAGSAAYAAAPTVQHTFAVTPSAPTDVAATAGDAKATVTWAAPTATGGSPITGYTVAAVEDASKICTPTPATALTCEVTGLANGTAYTFTVTANNGTHTAISAPSNAVTPLASTFSQPSPTGTGTVSGVVTGGNCGFERVQLQAAADAGAPATRSFVHGVLDFALAGCTPGATATVTVTYPSALPAQAEYWKALGGTWAPFAGAALGTSTATLTLVDGGAGDDDGAQNGRIVDPGGVSTEATAPPVAGNPVPVPTLGAWALVLLAALLAALGLRRRAGV